MRILWWSALALLLCLAVTSALRTQTNGTSRVNRRFSNSNRNPISVNKTEDLVTTSRAQTSRRRQPTESLSRTRSRNKPNEASSSLTNPTESQAEQIEQFDAKKSNSRIRNRRPVIDEANFDTTLSREKVKSRSRQTSRYSTPQPIQTTQPLVQTSSLLDTSATIPIEITNSDKFSKEVKEVTNNQFKRRSTTVRTVEATPASRVRGRINTRTDIRPLDLEVSGTANALTSAPKDPTTVGNGEIRNSRKLKYRPRQPETDTNLTGEGITSNERKSSPTREHASSLPALKKNSRSSTENIVEPYTEKNTPATTKVINRPVSRRKVKSVVKVEKSKASDEVTEDDNYPESFKALIQAKNASFQTHTSSPSSESLSVKASQKVFQTLTTTPQSFLTTPDVEKKTPLRKKLNAEDKNSTESDTGIIVEKAATAPEDSLVKPTEYRLRGTYTPRITSIISSLPVKETSTLSPSTSRPYKFSRKSKVFTTVRPSLENSPKPKRLETNLNYKKPIRSSFYPKRNSTRTFNPNSGVPKTTITERNDGVKTFNNYKSRPILPRTSYYSRKSSSTVSIDTTTELSSKDKNEVLFADKKMENTAEVPLIYTSLNRPLNTSVNALNHQTFLIKVTSKESSENGTDNEILSKVEENENEGVSSIVTTTQKYHATYKDNNNVYVDEIKKNGVSTLEPPIRNIQTRKFSRKPVKQREEYSIVTQKYRDRNLRKYSDTFSKTTEASSNGIIAEGDKPKSKFSSKYRASYLDKPFYRPTVPTITTSTVEGEEIQLGLDMNAISFTKTRSPLTSADLKLSESLAKPLQVMNVEASHHSPSVTVSIFDALAEILTSTPRSRISSTTEVQQNQNSNSDVKQTFDAVSSNINVNSVKDVTSQDTVVSKDNVNTIAQSVQITEQTTPNVSNRMSFGETITPSLNIGDKKTFPDTTLEKIPFTTPFPPPTTPLSARRPFAIKVLYAETEPPRDRTTTLSTLNMAMTDNPKMVHNTVSDLILSNNKLVSSELTSMLSNNIKNIIQNLDDGSKDRLSVEMVKLLNSLIPKLQKPMTAENDGDSLPNTTPYSLEDIKDTENIVIDGNEVLSISSTNILQNVDNGTIVNSTFGNISVNSSSSMEEIGSTASTLGGQTTLLNNAQPTEINILNFENPKMETTTLSTLILESLTNAPSVDVFRNNDDSLNFNRKEFTNNNTLVPFLTNFELNDFMSVADITDPNNSPTLSSSVSELKINTTSVPIPSLQIRELQDIDKIDDPSQLSRLQLWILSKKARVLKMIEELIRNHNDEISNAPLAELIGDTKENNLSFSNRLTEIVNTMTATTQNSDFTDENKLTSTVMTNIPETTTLTPQTSLSTQSIIILTTTGGSESMANFLTTTERSLDIAVSSLDETKQSATTDSDVDTNFMSTTSTTNEVSTTSQPQEIVTTDLNMVDETTSNNLGENSIDADTVTDSSLTTVKNFESTTLGSTSSQINNLTNELNISTTASIPKKDYVIFGILPNNTVTKQIRTEKPGDVNGNTIFKYIPIDQVTVSEQESNVLKLASTKMPNTLTTDTQTSTKSSVTEIITQSQVQNSLTNEDLTSTVQATTEMLDESNKSDITELVSRFLETTTSSPPSTMTIPVQTQIITEKVTTETLMTTNPTTVTSDPVTLSNIVPISTTEDITSTQMPNNSPFTVTAPLIKHNLQTASSNQNEAELLQSLLREINRSPKTLNGFGVSDRLTEVSSQNNNDQLLQSILSGGALNSKSLMSKAQTTTLRSIEDEIRQFEEDTKLLKALLQATGRNPAELNLPTIDDIKKVTSIATVTIPATTTRMTTTMSPTTTFRTTTTSNIPTTSTQPTTISINEDIRKLQEDTKLLQALLQATGNKNIVNLPDISGITSNVRIASNPFTTSVESNPTTPVNMRPVYTARPLPIITTLMPGTVTVSTLQPQQQSGDESGISTTFRPFNERSTTTIRSIGERSTTSRSPKSAQFTVTTEMPSTSTFSDEEDLLFLQNLKSVLSTKTGNVDPETALANRVIALAVEKSLTEIQTGKVTTTNRPITTSRTTTTTRRITTTSNPNTPSIEDDIKQFEQDTKLLQALLKATGQDPFKLNLPTLPPTIRPAAGLDLSKSGNPTTAKTYGAKIAVKDELKNEQDDAKLLQTLIKLQDAQETTTQRSKIALTGQSSDEALKKLLQRAQPTGMLSEATKSSVSLSTEYGNSNDALLAALLKEQGFGPTTASSLDEQLRLAALLNQVVVTPKARRTTTRPPPPPPSPRRPVLDGLAWLWQQWRETGAGGARLNRKPAPSDRPSSSAETSSGVNWFGSGPFVGNADEKPSSNRVGFASLLLKLCDWG